MPRNKDEPMAVRVYTVCDESRYLVVRNVPALGCGDDLLRLFSSYGEIEECKPMDAEDCEPFTDVYWIKFHFVNNARFAKRKLDEFVFLGNRLQVSYAPHFESLSDTKEKLEGRRREVLTRLKPGRSRGPTSYHPIAVSEPSLATTSGSAGSSSGLEHISQQNNAVHISANPISRISSDEDYFTSPSMNQTVKLVKEKLHKIQSSSNNVDMGAASKKPRVDNRRRI
ncbi:RNA recognition motif domain [Dillenia turbinata]|uniref:RNA-binding protein 48 n=1 Tax=Dillenia turbinata TaxID=194707 RepID=A0AAN8Z4D9_9MAGN